MPTLHRLLHRLERARSSEASVAMMASTSSASASSASTSTSPRRSSRRGGDSSAGVPNSGLSRDETAFGVLREHVLERGDFKASRDPDNVMARVWVRSGKERDDCVDGVDLIKEDAFTVKKYEAFWRKEMMELDDVVVAWGHRLPAEATSHLDGSLFEVEEDDARRPATAKAKVVAEVSPVPAPGKANKRKGAADPKEAAGKRGPGRPKKAKTNAGPGRPRKKAKPHADGDGGRGSKAPGKRRGRPRKATSDADAADGGGGLAPELVALRKEWFRALAEGQHKVGVEVEDECVDDDDDDDANAKKASSIREERARAARETRDLFQHNPAGCPRAAAYKEVALDPLARHIVARVDAHVARRATVLRNKLLDDLILENYKFDEAVGAKATGEDKSVKVADEGKGNKGG